MPPHPRMDEIELIKQKINIVELIQEYLPLKKAGVNFKAPCPFHNERTPSFVVSPERGIWHCFGCDKGGDIFKFLMEKEGLSFPDAIEILAKKAGVIIKKNQRIDRTTDVLYAINQKSQQFFTHILLKHQLGKKALEYLHQRGLTDETIATFGLGYAPASWESLTKFLKKRQFQTAELIQSGVCVESKNGCYDRFRGRIIFPLSDVRERIIGFSGRVLDHGEPKYINTPQSPIFDKSKLLFGMHLSKQFIRNKEAILVEGEMDMIMSFQTGIKNIIATKGTALTQDQLDSLKKYTDTLSLCFDTDLAGDGAARRGIEMAEKSGFNLKVVKIEAGKDPGELCLKDPEAWKRSVESATPIYDYYLESVERRFSPATAVGKKAIFAELLPIWLKISDPMVSEHYIQRLSALVQVKDEIIRSEMKKFSTQLSQPKIQPQNFEIKPSVAKKTDDIGVKNRRMLLEEYLISLLLHLPIDHTYIPNFPELLFTDESLKQVYVMLVIYLDAISFKGKAFKISEFIKSVPESLTERIDRLYLIELDDKLTAPPLWQKEVDGVVSELKRMLIKASLEKLSLEIKNAQEFGKIETLATLSKRFRDLSVKLKNL